MKPRKTQHVVIDAPTLPYFVNNASGNKSRHFLTKILLVVSWLLIVVSLTRPQWLDTPVVQTFPSRDLLLAVDISQSMQIKDMSIEGQVADRLNMVKIIFAIFYQTASGRSYRRYTVYRSRLSYDSANSGLTKRLAFCWMKLMRVWRVNLLLPVKPSLLQWKKYCMIPCRIKRWSCSVMAKIMLIQSSRLMLPLWPKPAENLYYRNRCWLVRS